MQETLCRLFNTTLAVLVGLFISVATWAHDPGATATEMGNYDLAEDAMVLSFAGVVNDNLQEVKNRSDRVDLGFGVLVQTPLTQDVGLETGVLIINRQYQVEKGNALLVAEVRRVHIPVLARYLINKNFSVGAGPFMAFRLGDSEARVELGGNEVASLDTSAEDDVEFGIDASAAVNFILNDRTGLFLEGRYSALFDQPTEEESNELSGLAGLRLDI